MKAYYCVLLVVNMKRGSRSTREYSGCFTGLPHGYYYCHFVIVLTTCLLNLLTNHILTQVTTTTV